MNRQRAPKFYDVCLAPGCTKLGNFARGFCSHHYLIFRRDCQENGSWKSGTPLASPIVIPHFVWEGDEDSLAAMVEEQERLRLLKSTQQKVNQENENV
jgi:hypothetical protein